MNRQIKEDDGEVKGRRRGEETTRKIVHGNRAGIVNIDTEKNLLASQWKVQGLERTDLNGYGSALKRANETGTRE
jgi:hypothetical protein